MDDTRIQQRIGVQASPERIWDLIADLPGWDRWNPHETGVEGRIAFGGVLTLTEDIPGVGARQASGGVSDWQPGARLVWGEKRGWLFRTTRYFQIQELERDNCVVSSGVIFGGLRGELFMDKHRSGLRQAHQAMVEGLKAAAEG